MNKLLAEMYGQDKITSTAKPLTEATNEFEIKTQHKNFVSIQSGRKDIKVATALYVKELEDKIEKQAKDIKALQTDNRKLVRELNSINQDLTSIKNALKTKMDRF